MRIINRHDIVPDVPTDPPFRHGGREVVVDGKHEILSPQVAHSLESYRFGIEGLH